MAESKISKIIISDIEPSGNEVDWRQFAWISTVTKKIHTFEGGHWVAAVSAGIGQSELNAALSALSGVYAPIDHIHSKESVKFKTDEGVMIFENGILVKIDK